MRWLRCIAPLLAACVLSTAAVPAAAQHRARTDCVEATRDWRKWPFSRRSPWNHPIGSGAKYAVVPQLTSYPIGINHDGRWTTSIVIAKSTDPVARMLFSPNWGEHSAWNFLAGGGKTCGNSAGAEQSLLRHSAPELPTTEGNYYSTLSAARDDRWVLPPSYHLASCDYRGTFRLPPGTCPSPDTDGLLAVFQPDGWVLDVYAAVVTSKGDVVGTMASWINARGDGTGWWNGRRASMLPSFAGLIRKGEIASGRIPHALAVQLPAQLLKKEAVWPAYAFDRDSGYSGSVPMGALLAIPPDVNIETLGLSKRGKVIAHAAQDYGLYVVDRGGGGITILAELGDRDVRWEGGGEPAWWQDLETIKRHLRRVTNNTATNRGGGGVLRAPLPPHPRPD
ncbi:MAG: hypothetical protein AB7V27_07185 [Candidatus Binatia bacterium]